MFAVRASNKFYRNYGSIKAASPRRIERCSERRSSWVRLETIWDEDPSLLSGTRPGPGRTGQRTIGAVALVFHGWYLGQSSPPCTNDPPGRSFSTKCGAAHDGGLQRCDRGSFLEPPRAQAGGDGRDEHPLQCSRPDPEPGPWPPRGQGSPPESPVTRAALDGGNRGADCPGLSRQKACFQSTPCVPTACLGSSPLRNRPLNPLDRSVSVPLAIDQTGCLFPKAGIKGVTEANIYHGVDSIGRSRSLGDPAGATPAPGACRPGLRPTRRLPRPRRLPDPRPGIAPTNLDATDVSSA